MQFDHNSGDRRPYDEHCLRQLAAGTVRGVKTLNILLAFFVLHATCVRAQASAPDAAPSSASVESTYNELIASAVDEFQRGNFIEARTLFEHAHAIKPSARTLRGLGFCAYELKHYIQAVHELGAAISETRNALSETQRIEVNSTIEKAKRFVGSIRFEREPPQTLLTIDGTPVQEPEMQLDAGEHTVLASAPSYRTREQRVTILGGQTVILNVTLVALDYAPPPVVPSHAAVAKTVSPEALRVAPRQPHADSGDGLFSKWWFWTAAGVVIAGSVTAVALASRKAGGQAAISGGSTKVILHPP